MKFEEALVEFRKGREIRIKGWGSGWKKILCNDSFNWALDIKFKDLLSDDWEVMEESEKTFPEVFEAFKEGKSIRRKEWLEYDETKNMYFQISDFYTRLNSQDLLAKDWEVIE